MMSPIGNGARTRNTSTFTPQKSHDQNQSQNALLKTHGVFCIEVAEIENLICTESVVREVSSSLHRDPEIDFQEVKNFVFSEFQKEVELQSARKASAEVRFSLALFENRSKILQEMKSAFQECVETVNLDQEFNAARNECDRIVEDDNHDELLRIYNRKGLSSQLSAFFDLTSRSYAKHIIRLLKSDLRPNIVTAIAKHCPQIEEC